MQRWAAAFLARDERTKRALVVRGANSFDELTPFGDSSLYDIANGEIRETLHSGGAPPDERPPNLRHTPEENLQIFNRLVSGEDEESAFFQTVRLNAGAGFFVAGKSATIDDGERYAETLLADGSVRTVCVHFQKILRQFGF
jgi:anthranilate phosphoribosyltransferase